MLNEQVVLITGAAGRIGAALARGVIAQGGHAVLVDVNEAGLKLLEAELPADEVLSIVADATSPDETDRCIAEAVDKFGRLDAAVHSAYPRSAGWGTRFEELKPEYLNEDLSRHLGGAILLSQRILEFF